MPKTSPTPIAGLFDIPSRFMRSVQLERDFDDPHALDDYIVTPAMSEASLRMMAGATPGSRLRAWRVTGDYGVGKSSFAVVLAHLLASPKSSAAQAVARQMGLEPDPDRRALWPFLVTGIRESLVTAVARGLEEGLQRRGAGKQKAAWKRHLESAKALRVHPSADALIELLGKVRDLARTEGCGVLLVIDELGKLLEYAAGAPERDDVYLLQRLAQEAARSGDHPFFLVGLLHQGFQAYAERLPSVLRNEWDKVAGRFEEIVFDQPLAHTVSLVAGALRLQTQGLSKTVHEAAKKTAIATAAMGWMKGATSVAATLETAQIYPLHPTLLPPLVRFFSRFGQHERSLFGFLLSSEPFALQAFSERAAHPQTWYGLPEFYDYVRAVFGHRLSGGSYQSNWLRIAATVETAQDLGPHELRLLKSIALLSLLDYPELQATDAALQACLAPVSIREVDSAIATLVDRGLLFRHGRLGGYRLWPSTSVNLHAAMEAAGRALGGIEAVSAHLASVLSHAPILARRHYLASGTMRHFEVRYAGISELAAAAARPTDADGLILIALADTAADGEAAVAFSKTPDVCDRSDLVLGVTRPLAALAGEVSDLQRWQWVAAQTPELAHDTYAFAEVSRQLAAGRRALDLSLGVSAALRERGASAVTWLWRGSPAATPDGLSTYVSDLCDHLFSASPLIANELLNRKLLSKPAAAARMRLIEGLFAAPNEPFFGIHPTKAPPEKSMFLSVIVRGGLQDEVADGEWTLTLPAADADPLRLRPALDVIASSMDGAAGEKVDVQVIFERLAEAPYGVRAGVAPLLLAVVMKLRAHDVAVYENGTFRPTFAAHDFMRLIKAPDTFALQLCRVEGVRAEVFTRLAAAFAQGRKTGESHILDVVQPLAQFAARLPEYTRKAGDLSARGAKVRDALLSATEPPSLLFRDLPIACGLQPFPTDQPSDETLATLFVHRLKPAIEELRADYPKLLRADQRNDRLHHRRHRRHPGPRRLLAQRAARVSATATLPKLQDLRAAAPGPRTPTTTPWAAAVSSYLLSKPPARWNAGDEQRVLDELASLSQLFRQGRDGRLRTRRAEGSGRPSHQAHPGHRR